MWKGKSPILLSLKKMPSATKYMLGSRRDPISGEVKISALRNLAMDKIIGVILCTNYQDSECEIRNLNI